MSSASTLPTNPEPIPTDPDCLDLGALLAPLSRDDIELIVVRLLAKYPSEAGWVVKAARKPVDALEVANEVKASCASAPSISACCEDIEVHIARSSDFLRGNHARNAVAVLEALTPATVGWLVEQGKLEHLEDEDQTTIQGLTALLENAWQSALEQCQIVVSPPGTAPSPISDKVNPLSRSSGAEKQARQKAGPRPPYTSLSTAELASVLAMLQAGMTKLKPLMGAIFSDPVRVLNRRVKAAMAAPQPPPAAAAAAAAAPSAPVAGTKRKAEADAPEAAPMADASSASAADAAPAAAAAAPADAAAASTAPSKPSSAKKAKAAAAV